MKAFLQRKISVWDLANAAGALGCLWTFTGFLGAYGWILELTSHFRIQYAALLGVIAGLLSVRRKFTTASVFAAGALINLGTVAPLYFGKPASVVAADAKLRVLLLNVDTSNRRCDLVKALIRDKNPHLFVLEEVDDRWIDELRELRASYPHVVFAPREDNFGIALFSRLPLLNSTVIYLGEAEVPSVVAEVEVGNQRVTVLGTHPLPPGSPEYARFRNEQLAAIPKFLSGRKRPVILLGDLNATPWSAYFKRLVHETGLIDSSRGRGIHPTWPANFFPLRIPIDHCLVSPGVKVLNKQVGPNVGSDHLPLVVEVALGP
jgi:endonuclease/exonuclease/phosphatase (EEP) superfamily protein YafD